MEESDYKLIRQVGSGLAGVVWSADGPSGRIAMRRFASRAVQGSADWLADRAHFLQGGRQSMTLRSPRIVGVHEVIDNGADAWIASEFVPCETLEALLKREKPPAEQTTYMLRVIAVTLDYAHKAGVAHGDLKPSNIFVGDKKSVRLADFAISPRARRSRTDVIDPSWVHPYLSPEHFISPAGIGERSDQYAMAAIAYHMYTGKAPFGAVGGDPGPAILRGQVLKPSSVNHSLPAGIDIPVLRALSRDPSQRYSGCIEFMEQLEAALVPAAGAAGAGEGASPRLMYAGLASLVVGVGIAGALLMSGNKGAKTERANTSPAEVAAKQASPASASKTTAPPAPAYVKPKPYPQPSPEADRQAVRRPAQPSPPRQAPQPNDSYVRPSTVAGVAGPIVDALRRSDPPAPAPAPVRPSPASPAEQFNPIFPSDFTAGYRLVVFNSRDPKHPIPDGQSFSTKDPLLGEMGSGDLKAQILLKGPPGKGKLSIEWTVDGTIGDGGFVSPNTVAVFRNEPYPGNYRVTLRRDLTVVAEYKFRITP